MNPAARFGVRFNTLVPGVNCQEKTYEELKETLEITLREALEFNRQDALTAAGSGYKEEKIAI